MGLVAISYFELHIPHARSLKDKRKVVKSLIDRVHSRYRVSIAETDHHDLRQLAGITLASVGRNDRELERQLEDLRSAIELDPEAVIASWQPEILDMHSA
ncbi:MAG TPA: DUF503 domain-containing protein [Thermoanaerobaculia bacterium]|nr:DUF503 domain-containing protein [Thermoanaerobaculia bacterium]